MPLQVKATAKYVRTSAQKAGLVMDLIRGKKASEALSILRFTKKAVARDIEKALRSAIANAVNVADKNQKRRLDEDDLVVSRVDIERAANKLKISIFTSRPGIIIGRKGQEVDKLKQEIQKRSGKEVFINIQEILKPELDAQLVAESVALQLEKRIAFRRAMRKAVDAALRFGAKGIKVRVSGRLNGAEIARSEWYLHGQLPLHTLRADIDYGISEARTSFGQIGVKCWIFKGEQDALRPNR